MRYSYRILSRPLTPQSVSYSTSNTRHIAYAQHVNLYGTYLSHTHFPPPCEKEPQGCILACVAGVDPGFCAGDESYICMHVIR
jgi:hypothetical protein